MTTNVTATLQSSVNRSVEAISSRAEDGVEGESDGRRILAVTIADFPRVLNGPAPGYAEDALRRLLGVAPGESKDALFDAGRRRNRDGALERAPAANGASEQADKPLDRGAGAKGGSASGAAGLKLASVAQPTGSEGDVGAALSEGFSWDSSDEKEEHQQQVKLGCCTTLVRVVFGDESCSKRGTLNGFVCLRAFWIDWDSQGVVCTSRHVFVVMELLLVASREEHQE